MVGWTFKNGQKYLYDRKIFEQTVRALIYRIKPTGARVLNLDFTSQSESVYVVLVSNQSTEYIMFRISSHQTFSNSAYRTFDTTKYNGFLALEKQLENELKTVFAAKKSKLKFKFEFQDYCFLKGLSYFLREQQAYFMMETRLFKQNGLHAREKRVLVVTPDLRIKGGIKDQEYLNLIQIMIGKGYLNAKKVNEKFSVLTTTNLSRNLVRHYGPLYEDEIKEIDFKSYFEAITETTHSPVKLNQIWSFQNTYYIHDFQSDLRHAIERSTPEHVELFEFSFDPKAKKASVTLIAKGAFLKIFIGELREGVTFATTSFNQLSALEASIKDHLRRTTFNSFQYEDYLLLKLLLKFEKIHKQLLIPEEYIGVLLVEDMGLSAMAKSVKRALGHGLAIKKEVRTNYSAVVITPLGKRLVQESEALYWQQFLNDQKQGGLSEEYQKAYSLKPFELVIEQIIFIGIKQKIKLFKKGLDKILSRWKRAETSGESLNEYETSLCEVIRKAIPENLDLLNVSFNKDENALIISLNLIEDKSAYLMFVMSQKRYHAPLKAFRVNDFSKSLIIGDIIKEYLNEITVDTFKRFKYEDYLEHKMLMKLKGEEKGILIPTTELIDTDKLAKIKSVSIVNLTDYALVEIIEDSLMIKRLRRALTTGMATIQKLDESNSMVIPSETAERLYHQLESTYSPRYLEESAEGKLPTGYLSIETLDSRERFLQKKSILGKKLQLLARRDSEGSVE